MSGGAPARFCAWCRVMPDTTKPDRSYLVRLLLMFVGGIFLWPLAGMAAMWLLLLGHLLGLLLLPLLPLGLLWMAFAKGRRAR